MKKTTTISISAAILLIATLAILQMQQESGTIVRQNDEYDQNSVELMAQSSFGYRNGTYVATGVYMLPFGKEDEINITLSIENDIIVAADFEGQAAGPASIFAQENFAEGFEEAVVGKKIDEIDIDVLNGASLTTDGFNDALEKIKLEAAVS
jgi:uncharacterized protein with FMN-binding domain